MRSRTWAGRVADRGGGRWAAGLNALAYAPRRKKAILEKQGTAVKPGPDCSMSLSQDITGRLRHSRR